MYRESVKSPSWNLQLIGQLWPDLNVFPLLSFRTWLLLFISTFNENNMETGVPGVGRSSLRFSNSTIGSSLVSTAFPRLIFDFSSSAREGLAVLLLDVDGVFIGTNIASLIVAAGRSPKTSPKTSPKISPWEVGSGLDGDVLLVVPPNIPSLILTSGVSESIQGFSTISSNKAGVYWVGSLLPSSAGVLVVLTSNFSESLRRSSTDSSNEAGLFGIPYVASLALVSLGLAPGFVKFFAHKRKGHFRIVLSDVWHDLQVSKPLLCAIRTFGLFGQIRVSV